MQKNYLWTKSKARLQLVHTASSSKNYNWLFLPGGPGLGSETLIDLVDILDLPDTTWLLDLPGDGSNATEDDSKHFAHWSDALLEATSALKNVILVAHSSGGMFALATPELEKNLIGLVLVGTAPNSSWREGFMHYMKQYSLPEADKMQAIYNQAPSNELLKELTIAFAPYFSTSKSLQKTINMFGKLSFNYKSHRWAGENFHPTYQAKWIPRNIPTMIFAGSQDPITPLKLFLESADFQQENIKLYEIKDAGHFPWLDKPDEIVSLFKSYCQELP